MTVHSFHGQTDPTSVTWRVCEVATFPIDFHTKIQPSTHLFFFRDYTSTTNKTAIVIKILLRHNFNYHLSYHHKPPHSLEIMNHLSVYGSYIAQYVQQCKTHKLTV